MNNIRLMKESNAQILKTVNKMIETNEIPPIAFLGHVKDLLQFNKTLIDQVERLTEVNKSYEVIIAKESDVGHSRL